MSAFLCGRLRLPKLLELFGDIRRNPVISRKTLLGMIFCMPFFGQTSMLSVDRDARRKRRCSLFGSEHRRHGVKMVAKELTVAKRLVRKTAQVLGRHAPTLWLVDGLYFSKPFFSWICRELQSHVLIKCKDPEFRDVLNDADRFFNATGSGVDPIHTEWGFDDQRLCSWTPERNSGEFAGVPVQVVRLKEHYPKRFHNRDVVTWIVTTDLALSCREIREAAHLRRRKERTTSSSACHICAAPNVSRLETHSRTSRWSACSLPPLLPSTPSLLSYAQIRKSTIRLCVERSSP